MFFILGIHDQEKKLPYQGPLEIHSCGKFGRYEVYLTYSMLHLFFIPLIKWNRKYYVRTTCCHSIYLLDPQIGHSIEQGDSVTILPQHLTLFSKEAHIRTCRNCHYQTTEDFDYCPRCGTKF